MKKQYEVPCPPENLDFRVRIKELIEDALVSTKVLLICGYYGFGKTMVTTCYFSNFKEETCWFDTKQQGEVVSKIKDIVEKKNKIKYIVIDNAHKLSEEEFAELKNLILTSNQKYVIISQSPNISLFSGDMRYFVKTIGMKDLRYNREEILHYFEKNDIHLSDKEVDLIARKTDGWSIFLFHVRQLMENTGSKCTEEIISQAKRPIFEYFDSKMNNDYTEKEKTFLLKIGGFERISLQMIKQITGESESDKMIQDICKKDLFITRDSNDMFYFYPIHVEYFRNRRKQLIGERALKRLYRLAGRYYEKNNEEEEAILCYLEAKDYQSIIDILVDVSRQGVGESMSYELEKYCFLIPEEWIKKSPELCGQLVIFSILKWNRKDAEHWKEYIYSQCNNMDIDEGSRKNWQDIRDYLEMILPTNSLEKVLERIHKYAKKAEDGNFIMHKTSMTVNRPSVINGQWDLSNIVFLNEEQLIQCEENFPAIYKEEFIGAANLIRAEICYEQDYTEKALIYLVGAINEIESTGNISLLFPAYFLQLKLLMGSGQGEIASTILNNLKKLIEKKNAYWLMKNFRAIEISYLLYENKNEIALEWLENEAPNENEQLNLLDVYAYGIKIRCYILNEQYLQALTLLEKLKPIAKECSRVLDLIEYEILTVAICERINDKEGAEKNLIEALQLAQKYDYVKTICNLGPLIYKNMLQIKPEKHGIDSKFFDRVMEKVKDVSQRFSFYLKKEVKSDLSDAEIAVLRLMAQAKTNGEIAENLCISINTVKFHCKNIYQKLGVNKRSSAVAIATQEKII